MKLQLSNRGNLSTVFEESDTSIAYRRWTDFTEFVETFADRVTYLTPRTIRVYMNGNYSTYRLLECF